MTISCLIITIFYILLAAAALDALAPALCGGYHERLLHADSSGAACEP